MPGNLAKAQRHKTFYRKLDTLLARVDREQGLESMLRHILQQVTDDFGDDIGLVSGRLYRDDGDAYVVVRSFGAKGKSILGFQVPKDYPIFRDLTEDSPLFVEADDTRLDPEIEGALGVKHFVAFHVGPGLSYVAAFGLSDQADLEEAMLVLSTLNYAIKHKLREEEMAGQLKEARSIQVSLLPQRPPEYEGFELIGRSIPAEQVGGDIFDFLAIDGHLMGIAIGDASGHGLPAALQARDVVTGLRMGVQHDLKITSVMNRLNRVIHQSGLTSRFVTVLYGELEHNGNFFYVNAGHDPGLLLRADGSRDELASTGIVLGPVEDIEYRRDYVFLEPGDLMVLYTDGVVERQGIEGEYGVPRLEAFVREQLAQDQPLELMADAILHDTFNFGHGQPWSDDATVVLVRRLPASE